MAIRKTALSTEVVMSMNYELNTTTKKIAAGLALICVVYLLGHYLFQSKAPTLIVPKVVMQKPQLKEVVEYVNQTGTTVAYNSVGLVARVEGFLNAIEFTDGSLVKKGQPLFVIQPEPYLEQLKGAQATVAAQKANLAYSVSEYSRQKRMYKQNATSLNNVEKWLAKTEEYQAEVDKAVANESIAAINYGYTHILAPFDGRIGRHLVDTNNLVGNGVATNLATLEQIDPIYVYFNLNELDLIKLRSAAKAKGFKPGDINTIPAYVKMQNEKEFTHKGTLDFVNTGLNASTGTMEFRALLKNKDYALLPGLFVEVRVPVSAPKKELTVPDTALLYDQIGPYVLTVDADNIVHLQRVVLGTSDQGSTPVTKGLTAQDNLIISGLQFATPGNKVDPQDQKNQASGTQNS